MRTRPTTFNTLMASEAMLLSVSQRIIYRVTSIHSNMRALISKYSIVVYYII